jgi:hypothetical protein
LTGGDPFGHSTTMSGPSHAVLSGSSRYSLGSNRKDSLVQSKVKRHQVVVACNACRKRKVKVIRPV